MATKAGEIRSVQTRSQGYASGMNMRDALELLAADEARIMENGVLDQRGAFDKRLGCISNGTFDASTDRILSMYSFYRGTSTPQVIIHTTAGKLYYTNDPSANPVVWTQIATGLSVSSPFSYETFNKAVYMGNGVDDYRKWDGATQTTFPAAPKGKFLRLWKDTMFMGGITSLDDRLYESAPGDAETWPAAAWVDIGKGDGDACTALGSDGLYLIFFKRNRHMAVYDPVTLANRVVDFEKGCESHFSVIQAEGEIYFLSRRGICRYLGDAPSLVISTKLDPLFQPEVLNLGALNRCYAYTVGNQIGWTLPEVNSTIPTMQVEYYPRLGVLSQFGIRGIGPFVIHRMPASAFARVRSGSTEFLYAAHNASNKFLYMFAPVGTDDGATFTSILETGAIDFGAPSLTKYIRRIRFLGRGRVTVQIKRNFGAAAYKTFSIDMSSSGDTWNPAETWNPLNTWGPDSVLKEALVNADAYGRFFQLRFSDSSTDVGRKLLEVGRVEYAITAGEWSIHFFVADADILGVRD